MRLVAVLLVAVLAGCANVPYSATYTRADTSAEQNAQDKEYCKKKSIDDAMITVNGMYFSDTFHYLVNQNMVRCMEGKGYGSPDIHPGAFKQAL
jgi:hypothetical protein